MKQIHLQHLIKNHSSKKYKGSNSFKWAEKVFKDNVEQFQKLDPNLNKCFCREELFEYCNDLKNSDLNVIVAIFSWGGMRIKNGRIVFEDICLLYPILKALRENQFENRKLAFEAFQNLRRNGRLSGLGISYFTKLICFLSPKLRGYIMDQWASKSINLFINW